MTEQSRLSFIIGMSISVLVATIITLLTFYLQDKNQLATFKHEANSHLATRVASYPVTLNALNHAYLQSDNKTEFTHSSETSLIASTATFDFVAIAPFFESSELAGLIHEMYEQGYENFTIKPFNTQQQHNNLLSVIRHIIPFEPKNSSYLGVDLLSSPQIQQKIRNNPQQNIITIFDPATDAIYLLKELKAEQSARNSFGFVLLKVSFEKLFSHSLLPDNLIYEITIGQTSKQVPRFTAEKSLLISNHFTFQIHGLVVDLTLHQPFELSRTRLLILIAAIFVFTSLYLVILSFYRENRNKNYHLLQNQKRYNQLLENTYEGIIVTGGNKHIHLINPVAEKLLGYSQSDLVGKPIDIVLGAQPASEAADLLINEISLQHSKNYQSDLFTKTFDNITCRINITDISVDGETEFIYFIEDITLQKETEKRIRKMAYFDALTQLESREYFQENLVAALSQNVQTPLYIMFIDLDGFKKVNDTLGHNTGDSLLKVISQRIQSALHNVEDCHICRFGGDEFIISIQTTDRNDIQNYALKLLDVLSKTVSLEQHEIQISASIGIANFPEDGQTPDTLLRRADAAMYLAKDNGKNTFAFYNDQLEENLSTTLVIENRLRKAIDTGNFQLHYQPQTDVKTGQIKSVEALIRWIDDELGFVPPDQFISVAEDTGQILAVGDWVITEAIHQLKTWQSNPNMRDIRIAINISSHQLKQEDFGDRLTDKLNRAEVPRDKLEIELTERSVMTNAKENVGIFSKFRDQGFSLSVDDFGTGYSSLSYLKRFPLNILKVDKSFVDGIPGDEDDLVLTKTIINLAHSLNMQVVAEGVETEEQLNELRKLNCDLVQGYLFSRPLPAKALEGWLISYNQDNNQ